MKKRIPGKKYTSYQATVWVPSGTKTFRAVVEHGIAAPIYDLETGTGIVVNENGMQHIFGNMPYLLTVSTFTE